MKVLLTTINSKYIHQNLAIRLLYELNKTYRELSWKEFFTKQKTEEIAAYCSEFEIVAFSCYIWNMTKTLQVAQGIKQINPGCKILLGGPEVSYDWNELIKLNEIDLIITGEGEISFAGFLNSFPVLDQVPGLIWKKREEVIENKPAEPFNLQELRYINPYRNDPEEDLKNKISYIESSRGCPHTCDFCLAGLDNKLRFMPLEAVRENLLFLMEKGKTIKFLDRTFNANPKFARTIFAFILENYKTGNIFQFEIKADVPQPELIEFINTYVPKGIFRFEIGIQTLNEKSNKATHRRQNFENVKQFIQQISGKIEVHLDLIVGLPYDYFADIKYSFEEVFKLFAPELQLGFLKFLKGTPIRDKSRLHAYKFDTEPPYQIFESAYLSGIEIKEITFVEKALEIYWNKKRSLHTLKYISVTYSIFDFLLGLGKYFGAKTGFKSYDLREIYESIFDYSRLTFEEDLLIPELIALDYYLQYKVKPKMRFLPKPDKSLRNVISGKFQLNHHKYRYIIHPIHFKPEKYLHENLIELADDWLVLQYNGTDKPQLLIVPEGRLV